MNLYVMYFSGNERQMREYLLQRYHLVLDKCPGKKVNNALEAAIEADDSHLTVMASNTANWNVMMGNSAQCFDELLTDQLSAASKHGEILMMLSQDVTGGLWFEYHKDGDLRRQWICIEGEVHANIGRPLNDIDAENFTDCVDIENMPSFETLTKLAETITGVCFNDLQTSGIIYQID